jgi:hypothetical protein
MFVSSKRRWVWAIAAAMLLAVGGVAAAGRLAAPKTPGVCVKEIAPVCDDASSPDAG